MGELIYVTALKAGSPGSIPKKNENYGSREYKTWTLFLVCSPTWLTKRAEHQLVQLFLEFEALGNSIGPDNLAVVFNRIRTDFYGSPELRNIAATYDGERAAEYCAHYGLSASGSPHILLTTEYPDLAAPARNFAVVSLGRASPKTAARLLETLSDQIRQRRPDQRELDRQARLLWFLQTLNEWASAGTSIFDKVTVTLNVGFLKVSTHASGKPAPASGRVAATAKATEQRVPRRRRARADSNSEDPMGDGDAVPVKSTPSGTKRRR